MPGTNSTITVALIHHGPVLPYCCRVASAQEIEHQEQSPPSISELRQLASAWKSSFRNLRVDGNRSYVNTMGGPDNMVTFRCHNCFGSVVEVVWIWSTERLDRFEETRFVDSGQAPPNPYSRMVEVYNGRNESYFTAEYEIGEDKVEHLKKLNITRVIESSPPVTNAWICSHGFMNGTPTMARRPNFSHPADSGAIRPPVPSADSIVTNDWEVKTLEMLLGSRCAKLMRVTLEDGEPQRRTEESLWLDLDHGGLPRRALVKYFSAPETVLGQQEYLVDEYQQVDGRIWFPKVARLQLHPDTAWLIRLSSVQLDVELRTTDFEPPAPEAETEIDHSLGLIMTTQIDSADKVQTLPPESTRSISGCCLQASEQSESSPHPHLPQTPTVSGRR